MESGAALGLAIPLGLGVAALGSGIGIGMAVNGAMQAMGRQPEAIGKIQTAMIIGAGSTSWTMVRYLAARLPAMILPRWLRNHSHPLAIDDVVWGLLAALLVLSPLELGTYGEQVRRMFGIMNPLETSLVGRL